MTAHIATIGWLIWRVGLWMWCAVLQITCSVSILLPLRSLWGGIYSNDHNVVSMTARVLPFAALLTVCTLNPPPGPSTWMLPDGLFEVVTFLSFSNILILMFKRSSLNKIFDGVQATTTGIIRGIGKQKVYCIWHMSTTTSASSEFLPLSVILTMACLVLCCCHCSISKLGAAMNLFGFYAVGLPLSLSLAFLTPLRFFGIWYGWSSNPTPPPLLLMLLLMMMVMFMLCALV